VQLLHDDALMATFTQHFLSQTGLSWMTPVVAIRGRGFHDGIARMDLLSRALTTAALQAKDNEVFVVLADLLECAPSISHLLPAVKMVLARHHRIAFVCPTPTFKRPSAASVELKSNDAEDLLLLAVVTFPLDCSEICAGSERPSRLPESRMRSSWCCQKWRSLAQDELARREVEDEPSVSRHDSESA
jgi:hypothetical protein